MKCLSRQSFSVIFYVRALQSKAHSLTGFGQHTNTDTQRPSSNLLMPCGPKGKGLGLSGSLPGIGGEVRDEGVLDTEQHPLTKIISEGYKWDD